MTTSAEAPNNNWLKSNNLARLCFAVALSAPVAGALVALVLGYTVFSDQIFMIADPQNDSQFVPAGIMGILANTVMVIAGGLILGAIVGWPVMLVFGLPAHAFLLRKTSAKAWIYALAGALAGLAAGALRSVASGDPLQQEGAILFFAIGAVTGVAGALVFWMVRRPDRDAASFKA